MLEYENSISKLNDPSWDDLRLFLAVASAGSLSAAAAATGVSAPTLGRRMLALEQAMGRTLFERGTAGYRLAFDGGLLLERVRGMEAAADAITEWQNAAQNRPIVSVGADPWTLRLIIADLRAIWSVNDPFRICLKVFEGGIDVARREAHVAVVAERPPSGNVAFRRSETRTYAAYRSPHLPENAPDWLALGTDVARAPWSKWIAEQPMVRISSWVNAPRSLLDACLAGSGRTILPCFVGDAEAGLVRCSDLIAEMTHDTYIIAHDDDRHRPEVRKILDRLHVALSNHRENFLGNLACKPPVQRGQIKEEVG